MKILATSRAPLRLAAEREVAMLLLALPKRVQPIDQVKVERNLAAARAALGAQAFEAAWAAGSALTLDQAVAEALEGTQ